ncbi:MAG: 2Fe-2S iron-sulfur cluster-binding protein, partial [Bdellovibrionota bacterium]
MSFEHRAPIKIGMGGSNPYIDNSGVEKPKKAYTITFLPMNVTVDVDPAKIPYDDHGIEGSVLEIAMGNGIDIDHACGGVSACSTCHIIVKEGLDTCNEANDAEYDQLDNAPKTTFQSRLACQTVPNGSRDVIVQIPSWN